MASNDSTCWTMVIAAAAGDSQARVRFADLYLDVVRAYLAARWRGRPSIAVLDDAVQEVFLECFRAGGALHGVERDGGGAFRTFLYGVVRNVALRCEERLRRSREIPMDTADEILKVAAEGVTPSVAFDRAWARALVARARERQRRGAKSDDTRRRVELLDLRFGEGLGIQEIATRWGVPADRVHSMYRRAREEFKMALYDELVFDGPTEPAAVEVECRRLLGLLGHDG